jgi:serine/threonine protein kinase
MEETTIPDQQVETISDQQVDRLFSAALEKGPDELDVFLIVACSGNTALRAEVERRLALRKQMESRMKKGDFMKSPAPEIVGKHIAQSRIDSLEEELRGRYKNVQFLAEGGMGEVYRAEDVSLRREAAIKTIRPSLTKDKDLLRRFHREAYSASALNHPSIITVYEFGETASAQYMVTEFVHGDTLRSRMERSSLKLLETLDVAIQVADGLRAAHAAGVVHRDIKPANIMLRSDGLVKILDFGIAKLTGHSSEQQTNAQVPDGPDTLKTEVGQVLGTFRYASPEQLMGDDIDHRTDIWSLGVVLYEMVARAPAFKGASLAAVKHSVLNEEPPPLANFSPGVPNELQQIVTKALQKDHSQRYQNFEEMLRDLKLLKQTIEIEDKQEMFIDKNPSYYLAKWKKIERSGNPVSWNWSAFLWLPFWAAYRKMYLYTGLHLLLLGMVSLIVNALTDKFTSLNAFYLAITVNTVPWMVFSLLGNAIYRSHVTMKLRQISAKGLGRDREQELIRRTGGTRVLPIFVALLFTMIQSAIIFSMMNLNPTELNESLRRGYELRDRAHGKRADAFVKVEEFYKGRGVAEDPFSIYVDPNKVAEMNRALRQAAELSEESVSLWKQAADVYEQASKLQISFSNDVYKKYCSLLEQNSRIEAERTDIFRAVWELAIDDGTRSLNDGVDKISQFKQRLQKLNAELEGLRQQISKLMQENPSAFKPLPEPSSSSNVSDSPNGLSLQNSIGIFAEGQGYVELIPAGHPLPANNFESFVNSQNNQRTLKFDISQKRSSGVVIVDSVSVKIPPRPQGTLKIILSLTVTSEKQLLCNVIIEEANIFMRYGPFPIE